MRNRKRQILAGSKEAHVTETPGEKPPTAGEGETGAEPLTPAAMPTAASGPRDAAGLADAAAAPEKRPAGTRARLDELDADVERQRREKREPDIEIAIRRGALELLGKEPGAVPENLTSRRKAILVKQTSEKLGVTARSLLPMVGIARSTYHYQLNAMKRPDNPVPAIRLRLGRAILHIRVLRDRPAIHMQTTRYLRTRQPLPVGSPDILHNGHRYRHDPFLPEHRPAATGRIQFELQLGNIQAAAPMPFTSPGNDDGTGDNHQPTLRKNTAEPAQQTLKQYKRVLSRAGLAGRGLRRVPRTPGRLPDPLQ